MDDPLLVPTIEKDAKFAASFAVNASHRIATFKQKTGNLDLYGWLVAILPHKYYVLLAQIGRFAHLYKLHNSHITSIVPTPEVARTCRNDGDHGELTPEIRLLGTTSLGTTRPSLNPGAEHQQDSKSALWVHVAGGAAERLVSCHHGPRRRERNDRTPRICRHALGRRM